ncbi:MAG: SUMF1/EgtB/PvdO family nonheme iron enzyme [Planctomycetia bacterium]
MNKKTLFFFMLFTVSVLSNTVLPFGNCLQADVLFFGSVGVSGSHFGIDFVSIGNPGNAADTTGGPNPAGAVNYQYGTAKYEVSEGMISIYNGQYGTSQGLEIQTNGRGANKPATLVSWNEAARFVNWLNTSTGGYAAYKFVTNGVKDNVSLWNPGDVDDYDSANPLRSRRAKFVLPSVDEWYKAAYFDPSTNSYYDYPTGSNVTPTSVTSGTAPGTAVFGLGSGTVPADIDDAGGLSPYGIMALGGNVTEWGEPQQLSLFSSDPDLHFPEKAGAIQRGGSWLDSASVLSATVFSDTAAAGDAGSAVGFRVVYLMAAVPEPGLAAIAGGLVGVLALGLRTLRGQRKFRPAM